MFLVRSCIRALSVACFTVWWVNRTGALAGALAALASGIAALAVEWGPDGLDIGAWLPLYVAVSLPAACVAGIGVSLLTRSGRGELDRRVLFYEKTGPPLLGRMGYRVHRERRHKRRERR